MELPAAETYDHAPCTHLLSSLCWISKRKYAVSVSAAADTPAYTSAACTGTLGN